MSDSDSLCTTSVPSYTKVQTQTKRRHNTCFISGQNQNNQSDPLFFDPLMLRWLSYVPRMLFDITGPLGFCLICIMLLLLPFALQLFVYQDHIRL